MAEQDLDRNEAATPYKLEKARERGSVAKSMDANGVAVLGAATLGCFAWADSATARFAHVAAGLLRGAGAPLNTPDDAARLLSQVLAAGLQVIAPLLFTVACVAIIINVAQAGVVFSVVPLKPDFARINPAQGFKRIVSLRGLYEAVKSTLKLLILGGVLFMALSALAPQLLALVDLHPGAYPAILAAMTGRLLVKLLLVLLVFAAIDWFFARGQYARQMRMSRREIKDEHKNREGDPRIRSRIRELRMKLLKRSQALRELPKADVLLTNPTRVAVALRYEHGVSPAPRVVAKGAGELARKMRDVAFRHQVPIVPSPVLARALYREADDGGYVPERWYADIARILVWLQAGRRARAASAAASAARGGSTA
jgi:flagellar biosynthetic protein FlhB